MNHRYPLVSLAILLLSLPTPALPAGDLIGEIRHATATQEDTLPLIARRPSIGLNEIELATAHPPRSLPGPGPPVLLPTRYILPSGERRGIIINIPEMRIYYFTDAGIRTWPIGVGREGWTIPYKNGKVIGRQQNPAWYPPKSIRLEHAADGDPLPLVVPPGPDNPLGAYALRLSLPGYLIHGTNKKYGIGMRVSHGCIRLYPQDIAELYSLAPVGTPFRIINEPMKLGIEGHRLYLEMHPPQVENNLSPDTFAAQLQQRITAHTSGSHVKLDWDIIHHTLNNPNGVPVAIGLVFPANTAIK